MTDTRHVAPRGTLHYSGAHANMSGVQSEPQPIGACIYCGFPTRGLTCIAHTDLPRRDPQIGLMIVRRTIIESWFGL